MRRIVSTLTIFSLLICSSSGCKSLEEAKIVPQKLQTSVQNVVGKKKEQPEFEEPVRMAAIWSDGIYDQVGVSRVRGFGARLFFYNEQGLPIKVDGELNVFGYDDSTAKEDFAPDRKFVFKRDNFQSHFSESELGDSYSVWVPWEKVGTERRTVSLIPVFKSANGTVIKGGQSVNVLPGPEPKKLEATTDPSSYSKITPEKMDSVRTADYSSAVTKSGVQRATYNEQSNPASQLSNANGETAFGPVRKSNATTIKLTRTMSNRLNSLPPQQPFVRKRRPRKPSLEVSNAKSTTEFETDATGSQPAVTKPKTGANTPVVFGMPAPHN